MTDTAKYEGKVLVAGATGKTGRWVVSRLQHYGIPVRVLARSLEKAKALGDVEVVEGKIQNDEDVAKAVEGCTGVISALGSSEVFGEASPGEVDRDGVIRLVDKAALAGVKHFGLVSSMAVTRWYHPLNLFAGVLSKKFQAEEHLRDVFGKEGRSYTVVRPGGLKDGEPLMHDLHVEQGDKLWSGWMNRSDVAEMLVVSLWTEKARNKTFEVIIEGEDEHRQDSLEKYYDKLAS
ncbi:SDR family oxidoreductase [Prosthecochloris sp. SCSIO W1101]|uniref:SDR family oxidoreductase n=1 Tax=Prosthecochloris sp. SCSIO W1101 TaxID=2992242 RepID=UPI00223D19AA|nr:SDR family oxidoreductase [Prosthecochloris sp. SCSIO W1101]UZJ41259.1 SDR family oxidoreductase [Prosthecochloris sp. SCSIO W1101]